MMSARSELRFPTLAPPSCEFHRLEGCTPMDCEYFRFAPPRDPAGKHSAAIEAEDFAVARAAEALQHLDRPKPTKSVPTKKNKGKGK